VLSLRERVISANTNLLLCFSAGKGRMECRGVGVETDRLFLVSCGGQVLLPPSVLIRLMTVVSYDSVGGGLGLWVWVLGLVLEWVERFRLRLLL